MDPNVWGPKLWDTLVFGAFHLPREDSLVLYDSMNQLIPCSHCLNSYKLYYGKVPPTKYSGPLEKWIWTIHDLVNQKLGKHSAPFSRIASRYKMFTHTVSIYDIFDVLIIIATQVKTPESLASFRMVVPIYQKMIRPTMYCDCLVVPSDDVTPPTLWLQVLDCKNNFHARVDEARTTREMAITQYFESQPVIDTTKIKGPGRRRRG